MRRDQHNESYPGLLARLDRIDGLIRRASEKAELPPFREILSEWEDVLTKAKSILDSKSR